MSRLALLLAVALPTVGAGQPAGEEGREAREQARLCERADEEEGLAACRAALALGLAAERRGPVRELLARHLVGLERWTELAEHYREGVRLAPESGAAWYRLGVTLLFALDDPEEAFAALGEAVRLSPRDAESHAALALALHTLGRYREAEAAFDEALELDPALLEGRPAARAVREAARRREPWP